MHKTDWKDKERPNVLVLFDVDGTLTPSRQPITEEMMQILTLLKQKVVVGFVGGSDLAKQKEQLGNNCIEFFDFAFSENGTTAYRKGRLISQNSFIETIGEEKYTKLVNYLLHYLADLNIPKKRGTFIEFRNSMINVSPIGRNCSYPEREEFEAYDKEHNIRKKLCADLAQKFPDFGLKYSIGGQISIDIFPIGWDKTYCLGHVMPEQFDEIHFFGDKTCPGGNDFEIAQDARVIAHPTQNPQETICQLKKLFLPDKK